MAGYEKFNNNPKNKITADCVIRAISKGLNKRWEDVFEDLVVIARKLKSVPTATEVYTEYLKDYETIPVMYDSPIGRKRYTIGQITLLKWEGVYIIKIAKHLTTIYEGTIYDIWDCGGKCAYKIWRVK